MTKVTRPVEIRLVDQDDQHWQVETGQGHFIGRIEQDGKKFLSFYVSEEQAHRHQNLDEATHELIMQFNLHQH